MQNQKRKSLISAALISIVALILLAAVFSILFARNHIEKEGHSAKGSALPMPAVSCSDDELRDVAEQLLRSFQSSEWDRLAAAVHPEFGLVFSPYSTVNLSSALCFTGSQIRTFQRDKEAYIWGVYDGTGEPIELTVKEYLARFVTDADYMSGSSTVDRIQRSGNALENLETVFENARYIDFYMPDPENENGMGWKSLHMVFEECDGTLYLSAIIHSEYTV